MEKENPHHQQEFGFVLRPTEDDRTSMSVLKIGWTYEE